MYPTVRFGDLFCTFTSINYTHLHVSDRVPHSTLYSTLNQAIITFCPSVDTNLLTIQYQELQPNTDGVTKLLGTNLSDEARISSMQHVSILA